MASRAGTVAQATLALGIAMLVFSNAVAVNAVGAWAVTNWNDAHATFYGGQDCSGTMGGACGYGNLFQTGYGTRSTALSKGLFNNGLSCGACYQLVCKLAESKYCYPGKSIIVTATNACPPGSLGGWCDPPRLHFDLSYAMFTQLAQAVGGVIPVRYKRVACVRQGGIRFSISGNRWFNYVLVHNVAGGGDISRLSVRGDKSGWTPLTQNWGAYWSAGANLVGQSLSFRASLGDGKTLEFDNVATKNWGFGQTFQSKTNFY